jgi:beta-phosphoglucomutase-like phosphatase (HAD superfamily)
MDGVLCNFERRYFERYKELPGSMRDRKDFNEYWDDFVLTKQFETLDLYPGAEELLEYLDSLTHIEKEILSSSGGSKYHDEVTQQKINWLKSKNIDYKPNIVSGRKNKSLYAKPDTVLIDDTSDVIVSFNKAGGIGILHKEIGNTLMLLKKVVADLTK